MPAYRQRSSAISSVVLAAFLSMSVLVFAQAHAAEAKLIALKLFPDTAKGHYAPALEGREFVDSQQRQLMLFQFDPKLAGQQLGVRILATKTTSGINKEVKAFPPTALDKEGRMPLEIKLPRPWPVGEYRAEFLLGGKVVETAEYRVRAAVPRSTPIEFKEIKIYRNKDDGSLEQITKPQARDRQLYFAALTRGVRTSGANTRWSISALNTEAGTRANIGGVYELDKLPLEDSTLTFDIEMPRDWPAGKYRVEVLLDGKTFGTRDFDIVP